MDSAEMKQMLDEHMEAFNELSDDAMKLNSTDEWRKNSIDLANAESRIIAALITALA